MRKIILSLALSLVAALAALPHELLAADYGTPTDEPQNPLKPFAEQLADMRDRARRVIYTPYPVSAQHGLVRSFVHVGDGTAVLSRIDLVVDGNLPLVIRRTYSSAGQSLGDFGASGWRLTLDERIVRRRNGGFVYTYGNRTSLELDSHGKIESALQAYLTDVERVRIYKRAVDVYTRTGVVKRFDRVGEAFRITSVIDSFGNWLAFEYGPASGLSEVRSSSGGSVSFTRDDLGRVTAIRDSHGRTVQYTYDTAGRLDTVVDPGEHVWRYRYDEVDRLVATIMPSEIADIEFQYDLQGRVTMSRANGARYMFAYSGPLTTVTDHEGTATRYRAAPSGLTVEVTNALGTRTALTVDRSGLPIELSRNDNIIARFSEGFTSRGGGAWADATIDGHTYRLKYDAQLRVKNIHSAYGMTLDVERYSHGLTPAAVGYGDGSREEAQWDERGNLRQLVRRSAETLTFERVGARWHIKNASKQEADLEFDPVGRLVSATAGNGQGLRFTYNAIGLRETTETSYGGQVQYQYDASGSLFFSATGLAEQPKETYSYLLKNQQVSAIVESSGERHDFRYDEVGRLDEIRASSGNHTRFQYDELSRVISVDFNSQRLEHQYVQGEPDIARRLAARTLPLFNQQKEITDFSSRFDIFESRIQPAALGLFTYDEVSDELELAVDPAHWTPIAHVVDAIKALRIDALLSGRVEDLRAFNMPSNRLFVPPEFWSVNCCHCPCEPDVGSGCLPNPECGCGSPPPPPPAEIRIEYTMFIPLDHVRLPSFLSVPPFTFFGGDNKGNHVPGQTSFRIQQVVRWRPNHSLDSAAQSGLTGEYYEATRLTSEGSCYRKTCPSCPTYPPLGEPIINQGMCKTGAPHATGLAGGMQTIVANVLSQTLTSVTLRFSGEPFNILEPLSQFFGDIDWRHTLTVDWSTTPMQFTLEYQHDGFPYHDLRINGLPVRLFDPVPNGQTPLSLNGTGSGEWTGTVSGSL